MIHHCGTFDGFIEHYKKWPKPAMVQIGQASDPKLALDSFPDALVDYCYTTSWLISASTGDVREHTKKLLEETKGDWHRLSVSVGDLDRGIPEDYIMEIYDTIMQSAK